MIAPHAGQPVLTAGEPIESARAVAIMMHGRGASAEDILSLVPYLTVEGMTYLAPQAAGGAWYPYSFLAPLDDNEPGLSSALSVIDGLIAHVMTSGIAANQIVLMGFSQGACLAAEYAARHPQRFGGVVAFSGGVIGPPNHSFDYSGDLAETPVFVGCSDVDPHIPLDRVEQTANLLGTLGANVDKRIYPGMPHTIIEDEISAAQAILKSAAAHQ